MKRFEIVLVIVTAVIVGSIFTAVIVGSIFTALIVGSIFTALIVQRRLDDACQNQEAQKWEIPSLYSQWSPRQGDHQSQSSGSGPPLERCGAWMGAYREI